MPDLNPTTASTPFFFLLRSNCERCKRERERGVFFISKCGNGFVVFVGIYIDSSLLLFPFSSSHFGEDGGGGGDVWDVWKYNCFGVHTTLTTSSSPIQTYTDFSFAPQGHQRKIFYFSAFWVWEPGWCISSKIHSIAVVRCLLVVCFRSWLLSPQGQKRGWNILLEKNIHLPFRVGSIFGKVIRIWLRIHDSKRSNSLSNRRCRLITLPF